MPFIPHTEADINCMLDVIGESSIEALFDEIPAKLRSKGLDHVPKGLNEMEMMQLMQQRAAQDEGALCFIGAGAYEHHIPSAVWDVATRGEFLTAYTPYQAEASQGSLQVVYEYQSMMAHLTGMDVSNASMYDGASAMAEAVLMAIRANRKSKSRRVLVAGNIHPNYRATTESIVKNQNIECVEMHFDLKGGHIDPADLEKFAGEDFAAVVLAQPNFFGGLEEVDAITDWAHNNGMLMIAVVNPVALALITPPGEWGESGADITVGEGQPLGIPLASGGPYMGFMCCTDKIVRQMPGRIIGRTVDMEGKEGFALTLQAREQHIRRGKATSNICTNQGLAVTAATIHMSLLGHDGLQAVALSSHNNAKILLDKLTAIDGVEKVFDRPFFHEVVVRLPRPVKDVIESLAKQNILAGYSLYEEFPQLENCIVVCATETKTEQELGQFTDALKNVLENS